MTRVPRPAKRQVPLGDLAHRTLPGAQISDQAGECLVSGIELDSRLVLPGDIFAAIAGHATHGARFVDQALANGAAAILTDPEGAQQMGDQPVPVVVARDPRRLLGGVAAGLYGEPRLTLLGITGTNGKTTVAAMLEAGLREAGRSTGVIGTTGIRFGDVALAAGRTTPEAVHLHALLGAMGESGVDSVAMEVSSHAVAEKRIDGLLFDVAGFTNLTRDHLDYHGTMDRYFAAKARLFTPAHAKRGVVGVDDAWGARLAEQAAIPIVRWTTVPGGAADWRLEHRAGEWLAVAADGGVQVLAVPLPGAYNRANALCALAMLDAIGVDRAAAARGIARVRVPGRMEVVGTRDGVTGIVDYAHSPDAVARAVDAAREGSAGRIIVVIGAGGDRDREKRPLMGGAAARLADCVIVTDDNPRSEDPSVIRQAVLEGAQAGPAEVRVVPDRRDAIVDAVTMARPGDRVLVLGKGHEQGQEVAGIVHPFDDRDELRTALASR